MKGAKEIDFLFRQGKKKFLPIEVKYQNNVSINDFDVMKKHGFENGILISKDYIDINSDFKILPVELFLLLENAIL